MVRDLCSVENCQHWVMDMAFRDDESRVRTDQAPENLVTLKHMAANLARKTKGNNSIRLRLKTAAWDDDYPASLIAKQFLQPIPCLRVSRKPKNAHESAGFCTVRHQGLKRT